QSVVVSGSYKSIEDLKEQIIGVDRIGNLLKLKDIATVRKDLEQVDQFQRIGLLQDSKVKTKTAVLLNVSITETADIVAVKEKLDEKIGQLRSDNKIDKNIQTEFLYDQSESTQEQVSEIVSGAIGDKNTFYLLGGIQLVLLAMLLFVNWRAAIVAASAIPISFFFTLMSLYFFGVQLNTIVLFSLILVLGLIVDPAIVVLESIQRYLDLGRDGRTAVIETGKRYGAGLFIAVATSIIVFVPFGVVSGIFGEIIKYIPLTVVPALIASYFVPLAILPFLAARFLKSAKSISTEKKNEDENIWLAAKYMMKFNNWVLSNTYHKILFLVVTASFIFFSLRLVFSGAIPVVQFSSPPDSNQISVTLNFPRGETFTKRNETAKEIEQEIDKQNGIDNYFYLNQSSESATIFVNLKEKRSKNDSSKNIQSRLKDALQKVKNVDLSFAEISVGPPESEYSVQVQLFANNLTTLEKAAKNVGNYLSNLPEIDKVDDG
ncbi:MAG: efflux RND transporter permease subunit, partial [Candidatus Magasanikbacteria bacterium]|nr:efflux RND transporter permease subunit [Candidatus Magasanikbacteria bacterium]